MPRKNLIAQNKLEYARGNRPKVDCILCAVRDSHPEVDSLEVYRDDFFLICINLYPYNPGHIMLVPLRHIEWPYDLTDEEALHLHHLQKKAFAAIHDLYQAPGYNVGYNLGSAGGGSISHLHLHIVPRFYNEHGFMGSIGNVQLLVENPQEMRVKFQHWFQTNLPDR